MKKTLSIHLGRQLFIIEEDAYDRLQQYLQRLEQSLKAETGIAEIMEDIEMRFAELIFSYLGENRKVVSISDVEKGIASLGEPEEISEEPTQNSEQQRDDRSDKHNRDRRLYRDTEDGILAGVASGIAAYFNIDPVIVRIAFFLLSFTGIGVPAYILFWIILPNAVTPSDRLRMRGKQVTVDSLKEEFVKATDRIKDDTLRARDRFKNSSDHIAERSRHFFRVVARIVGFGLVAASALFLLFFTLTVSGAINIVPITGDSEYLSVQDFLKVLIPVNSTYDLMWSAILLIGFCGPLIGIGTGMRMLTGKTNRSLKIGMLSLSTLFGAGIIFGLISGLQTGRDFAVYSEIEQQHLTANVETLTIDELNEYTGQRKIISTGGVDFIDIRRGKITQDGIWLTYRPSKDSLFHVYQVVSAHGVDRNSALKRSGHIQQELKLTGNKLFINPHYSFPVKDGLRNQEIEIIVEIPDSKKLVVKGFPISSPNRPYKGIFRSNESYDVYEEYSDDYNVNINID